MMVIAGTASNDSIVDMRTHLLSLLRCFAIFIMTVHVALKISRTSPTVMLRRVPPHPMISPESENIPRMEASVSHRRGGGVSCARQRAWRRKVNVVKLASTTHCALREIRKCNRNANH
jgi:hypothetical protein